MTTTGITEKPTVFECNGSRLIGIFHIPPEPVGTGVITLIAGGPQYRGGVSRGMVSMARDLCAQEQKSWKEPQRQKSRSSSSSSPLDPQRRNPYSRIHQQLVFIQISSSFSEKELKIPASGMNRFHQS